MEGNRKERLTDALVRRLPLSEGAAYAVRDTELVGFLVIVGRSRRTYAIQMKLRGQNIRQKVGFVGDLPLAEARAQAAKMLADLRTGTTTHGPKARGVTLGEAWADYLTRHLTKKGRSPGTIANYTDHMERLFTRWLDRPLLELAQSPKLVADRLAEITRDHGPYIANGAARSLRAVYNWAARKIDTTLPVRAPVHNDDLNEEHRRNTAMSEEELAVWKVQLDGMKEPLRREFHLLCLLSGSRPAALSRARWEHLDLAARVLHFPDPKGGARKAFDMPLSLPMVSCLRRARDAGEQGDRELAATFIFPAQSASGHLEEWKENRETLGKYGVDLRQTFATHAQLVGVPDLFLKLLMNHATGKDVTLGYVSMDKLRRRTRAYQRLVSRHLVAAMEGRPDTWTAKVDAAAKRAGYTSREGVMYGPANDTVSDAAHWELEVGG